MVQLTNMQRGIFEYIRSHIDLTGYPPSVREIGEAVGLHSPSTVHSHLNTLEKLGYISRNSGKTRAISLPNNVKEMSGIPILGDVAAGAPILAVEAALGYLPYHVDSPGEYFALRIRGDSMIKAGILDKDMVIVKRTQTAANGEIIIALLGDEATCKRFLSKDGIIWLIPENDNYEPLDGTNMQILGKVTAVIRTY